MVKILTVFTTCDLLNLNSLRSEETCAGGEWPLDLSTELNPEK